MPGNVIECQLFQDCRDIDLREQRLYLFHAHPAREEFGDLREHTGIFCETALIMPIRERRTISMP